jgi:MFS transporter, MHS family, proline/betaine transporter
MIRLLSIGTLLEWAEYTFYGYMGIVFSTLFFPESAAHIGMIKAYGIFAAGYLMRPFGAILFGYIGDTFGRKPALTLSLLLMGGATFCIGCLPTYQTLGLAAAVLLLILRLIQGLAISGEYNGAGIFIVEKCHSHYPCTSSSWVSASAAAGMVCGGIAALLTSLPMAPEWAWRVPFLLGGVSCLLGFIARRKLEEPAVSTISNRRSPLIEVFKHHKRGLIVTGAIAAFTGVYVYIGNIYIVSFLKQYAHIPTHHATFFAILGEIIVAITIPLMAYRADKTDPYQQYSVGLIFVALCTPVVFMLCLTEHYGLIALAMAIYGILNGLVCGPMIKILCDQFPAETRYTGVSFAYNAAAAIFSGTALMVAQTLASTYEWILGPSLYVSLIALLTYVITRFCWAAPQLKPIHLH